VDIYRQANRQRWNELVALHHRSRFYDVDGFKAGQSSLRPLEIEELGDVSGKSLLHLQCHFGLDTLSWARRGARVTGVDFADEAIALAQTLSRETGLDARFVCSSVEDLPGVLRDTFDIVFTSYGVLWWLADLRRWAEVIAHFLKPGGTFYLVEIHPFADVFDDRPDVRELRPAYPYFASPEPWRDEAQGSYADREARVAHTVSYGWPHSIGDILNALLGAGLHVEFLHEFPYCVYAKFPFMHQGTDGWWRLPEQYGSIPLLFSLKASSPAEPSKSGYSPR
jgi:SAM-dependent methyltransferase